MITLLQLVNKFDELLFTKNDENFVEAFAIFCGMGIHNTHMYEKAITAMAKQSVTLDVSTLFGPFTASLLSFRYFPTAKCYYAAGYILT